MTLSTPPVLVVEDSDEDFDTVLEASRHAGLPNPIRRATSGDHCLRLLRGSDGEPAVRPAFVLLDLNTPGTDGRDALAEIREDAALHPLPIIVLSTSGSPRDVERCYRCGANAYHVKRMRYLDHLQLVQEILAYWIGRVLLPGTPTSDLGSRA